MDLCIYKINNGYKIGKRDGSRLDEHYGKRYYITKRPMRRDPAKKLLMKLQLAEKGITMNVKSKKKIFRNGFIRIDAIHSKKKKRDSQANNFFNFNLKTFENWFCRVHVEKMPQNNLVSSLPILHRRCGSEHKTLD